MKEKSYYIIEGDLVKEVVITGKYTPLENWRIESACYQVEEKGNSFSHIRELQREEIYTSKKDAEKALKIQLNDKAVEKAKKVIKEYEEAKKIVQKHLSENKGLVDIDVDLSLEKVTDKQHDIAKYHIEKAAQEVSDKKDAQRKKK